MGVIVRSLFCIGVITAISPLNDSSSDVSAQATSAGKAIAGHAVAFCAKKPDLCKTIAAGAASGVEAPSIQQMPRRPGG